MKGVFSIPSLLYFSPAISPGAADSQSVITGAGRPVVSVGVQSLPVKVDPSYSSVKYDSVPVSSDSW